MANMPHASNRRAIEDLLEESVGLLREQQKTLKEIDDKLRKMVIALSYR